jgi:hypothetical protein
MARALWFATGGESNFLTDLEKIGSGDLPSVFAVSDLAAAAIGTAWFGTSELIATQFRDSPAVRVDRRLASRRSAVTMGFARKQVRKRGSEVVGARVSGERRTVNAKRRTANAEPTSTHA